MLNKDNIFRALHATIDLIPVRLRHIMVFVCEQGKYISVNIFSARVCNLP